MTRLVRRNYPNHQTCQSISR